MNANVRSKKVNLFTLFIMFTAIAGSVGAIMAAKSQTAPSSLLAAFFGIAIGAIVYFVPFRLTAMAASILPAKKERKSAPRRDFPILFACLWMALLPAVAGVSAYWLVIRMW